MPTKEEFICISCPVGCTLDVTHDGETVLEIDGNACPRGEDYVEKELTDPRRNVATTVQVSGGVHPLVPVYTDAPIPKPRIFDLLDQLREVQLEAPVEANQVVLGDVLGTEVNVRASRDLPKLGDLPKI
jgi:CxxC motif-containing protein